MLASHLECGKKSTMVDEKHKALCKYNRGDINQNKNKQ